MSAHVTLKLDLLPSNLAARIAYFVAHAGHTDYVLDNADPNAVTLIDDDALASREQLAEAQRAGRTVLLLSSKPRTLKGVVVIVKPVSGQKLLQAALPLRLLLSAPNTASGSDAAIPVLHRTPPSDSDSSRVRVHQIDCRTRAAAQRTPTTAMTPEQQERRRWRLLCGDHSGFAGANVTDLPDSHYKHERTLTAYINTARHACRDTGNEAAALTVGPLRLYLVPATGLVFSNLSIQTSAALNLAASSLAPSEVRCDYIAEHSAKAVRDAVLSQKGIVSRLESFLWLSALLASRGRLPEGTRTGTRLQLRYWPDMTRLELFPHAMELAARWLHQPASLQEMIARTDFPSRFTVAFYNAAQAIDAFDVVGEVAPAQRATPRLSLVREPRS